MLFKEFTTLNTMQLDVNISNKIFISHDQKKSCKNKCRIDTKCQKKILNGLITLEHKIVKKITFEIGGVPLQHIYYCKKCSEQCTIDIEEELIEPKNRDYLCKYCYDEKNK